MEPTVSPPTIWMLDACCALNLLASGHFEAILRTPVGGRALVYTIAEVAAREAASLRRGGTGEDAEEREPVDWAAIYGSGLVRQESLRTDEEIDAFVSLASNIGDGEAMTLAIASARGYGVITDDRKALRFLGTVPHLGTLDLLHNWSQTAEVDASTLGTVLNTIGDRARFTAPRAHPLREWWERAFQ